MNDPFDPQEQQAIELGVAADAAYSAYSAYVEAGFSEYQAFQLTVLLIKSAMPRRGGLFG